MIFCHKCGAKANDGAVICSNCGERLILDDNEQQADSAIQSQMNNSQPNMYQRQVSNSQPDMYYQQKKKSYKLPIILGIAAFIVVAFIIIICLSGDKINYVATVKAHKPFATSENLPYTYDEVFNKYVRLPVWELRKVEDDTAYVNMSGAIKDIDNTYSNLVLTFTVKPNPNDPNGVLIHLSSGTLDGKSANSQEHLQVLISAMFSAYDQKYDNLSDYINDSQSDSNYESDDGNILQSNSNSTSNGNRIEIGETKSYNNNDSNLEVTLDYVEFVDEVQNELIGNYMYPEDGNVFLRAAITVKNVGTKAGQFLTAWNTIIYDNTYEFDHFSVEGNFIGIKPLSSPVAGALIFEVPIDVIESDKSLVLNINDMMIGEPIISYTIRPDTNSSAGNKTDITGLNTYNSSVPDSIISDSNNAANYDILYKDIPINTFFNQPAANVVQSLGWTANTDRDDDIRLYINSDSGFVETAEIWNVSSLTINGTSLEKNRSGLVELFGESFKESNSSGYSMRYEFPYYAMNFELGEPNSAAWRVSIIGTN